jgi:GntR family transcriptional regulator, transcriptional repressor for pyruvate dehydrogenase complex
MPLDLARIEKKAISESVAEQLRLAILRGEVAVGERLPPERQLAPRFGTNRNTLREAIRSLEAQGLVTVRQGDGVRVADFSNTGELSLLPDMLRVASRPDRNDMLRDLLWMRRRMAVEVARAAAERASDESVAKLHQLLEKQRAHDGDLLLMLQTDLELYRAMVGSAFTVLGRLLFKTMAELSRTCLEQVPAFVYVHPDYLANMTVVVEAIASGDGEAAATRLDAMLGSTDAILLKRLDQFPDM